MQQRLEIVQDSTSNVEDPFLYSNRRNNTLVVEIIKFILLQDLELLQFVHVGNAAGSNTVDYLVVAGGGGGGEQTVADGGGAGGFREYQVSLIRYTVSIRNS